jgi:hypothetical protein
VPYPNSALRSRLFVVLACFSLAGCPSSDEPLLSRDCAGFENPGAAQWMPVASNADQAFTSRSGELRNLRVTNIETDPPYRETEYAPDASQVSCIRNSTVTLTGPDIRISTEWEFTNIEDQQGQPIEQQRLLLSVITRVVGQGQTGPPYSPSYNFRLHDLADPFNASVGSSGATRAYYPTRTINGVSYTDVLEASIRRNDASYPPLSLPEADWVRIVIARGAGLVQYELRNGQIFTRQ